MGNLVIPNHIAIIPDGNRRWGRKCGLKPWESHRYGVEKFEDLIKWCLELDISQVSIWVLSTENLKNRSKREIEEIFKLIKEYAQKWEKENSKMCKMLDKYEVKVRFLGDLRKLPPSLVKLFKNLMKKTEKYNKRMLNFLINYGGRFELTEVVKKIVNKAIKSGRLQITEKTIKENLLITDDVDLVIRTGGMPRLSNLMAWQTAYAEIYVTNTLWPDFDKKELIKAIKWFNNIKRNFGK